nr:uncharacterized protein LOC117274229 [Nicotiana tomentosiformis]
MCLLLGSQPIVHHQFLSVHLLFRVITVVSRLVQVSLSFHNHIIRMDVSSMEAMGISRGPIRYYWAFRRSIRVLVPWFRHQLLHCLLSQLEAWVRQPEVEVRPLEAEVRLLEVEASHQGAVPGIWFRVAGPIPDVILFQPGLRLSHLMLLSQILEQVRADREVGCRIHLLGDPR